jgi:hypothetical protein
MAKNLGRAASGPPQAILACLAWTTFGAAERALAD